MIEPQSQVDWRKIVRRNNLRAYIVILSFFLLYAVIGFFLDIIIYEIHYGDLAAAASRLKQQITIPSLFTTVHYLLTFELIPFATIIMITAAAVSFFLVCKYQHRIILNGTLYNEINDGFTTLSVPERELLDVIEELRIASGLKYRPRTFIIEADYINALASGFTQKSAMLAFTRGALTKLNRDELEAIAAHELSHIHHMDIKSTLSAAILSNYMILIVNLCGFQQLDDVAKRSILNRLAYFPSQLFRVSIQFILLFMNHSREFKADAGCVELMRVSEPLAQALIKIKHDHTENFEDYNAAYTESDYDSFRREFFIFDPALAGIFALNAPLKKSTQPSVEERVAALKFKSGDPK